MQRTAIGSQVTIVYVAQDTDCDWHTAAAFILDGFHSPYIALFECVAVSCHALHLQQLMLSIGCAVVTTQLEQDDVHDEVFGCETQATQDGGQHRVALP